MKQTGLIIETPKPTDWVMGVETGVSTTPRLESGDWTPYLPLVERQNIGFETFSCVTFSALSSIEAQIKLMLEKGQISSDVIAQLKLLGYMNEAGELNFSDRFTAIMSETTRQGNTFTKVWDSIRKDGLLPEKDLPFGGDSFDTYHNSSLITPEMKSKAKIILGLFSFQYDWVFSVNGSISDESIKQSKEASKICPLQCGVPYPANHAVMFYRWQDNGERDYFDTYDPFRKHQQRRDGIHFGLRGVVSLKDRKFPIYVFNNDLYAGLQGQEVVLLQQILNTLGLLKVSPTGFFGTVTRQAVIDFQQAYGIRPYGGYVGEKTRKVLNEICSYDDPTGAPKEPTWWEEIVAMFTRK